FTEMEIFRNVVFIEEDQLVNSELTKRTSEIKRLISGSREASYETALADLNAELDKLKRLPRKRNDRELEELEKALADLVERVAVAEKAELHAIDLLDAELSSRAQLSEIESNRSALQSLLESYRRQHDLRSRLDQQTKEYAQASEAFKRASTTAERHGQLVTEASRLHIAGDLDVADVRALQIEQSSAIAACRDLQQEIDESEATTKRLRQTPILANAGRARTRPRYELLVAAAVVALVSLVLGATFDARALTGLPVAGMLIIAAFLFPKTTYDSTAPAREELDARIAEEQRARAVAEMAKARLHLETASACAADLLARTAEPTLDALIARLERLHETNVRLTEAFDVGETDLERLRAAADASLTDVAITKRAVEQLQAEHPELLDLTSEGIARHQRTILQLNERETALRDRLNAVEVDRQVLRRTTIDDAAALRVDVREKEKEIRRKRRLAAALELAIETMESCVHDFQEHALDPVGSDAGQLLRQITDGRHSGVAIDQESMTPTVTSGGRTIDVETLSRGARDQLFLAIRVALVEALSGGHKLPLIFDDPCVHFDAERLAATAQLLQQIARERQVIVLSKDESYSRWFNPILRLPRGESSPG
ncbi:MAG TPA: hypothetical protein VHV31_11340, partial [Nitrolancea sp.]|nr:hypothetical protein [Nitrolancea sp.]